MEGILIFGRKTFLEGRLNFGRKTNFLGLFLEDRIYFIFETLILEGSFLVCYGSGGGLAVMIKIEVRVFN